MDFKSSRELCGGVALRLWGARSKLASSIRSNSLITGIYPAANARRLVSSIQNDIYVYITRSQRVNTLRPRQNGRHFADAIFKRIFLNENIWIPIEISLMFVPKGSINNIPALVLIMAWRRPGDKSLSEPMMVNLPTHICVTRPQWVKPWCENDE